MTGASTSGDISTRLQRIAKLAREAPDMQLRTLAHHMDIHLLREAYRLTRKSGAVGVDGKSAAAYGKDLEANLKALLERIRAGRYRAPPVRRVHIPKAKGKTRPIGIPTFEDKVLQRAVALILNAVYEGDFYEHSYGFRPGRSAHQALGILWQVLMDMRGGWVLDVDIQSFFDTLDHKHLQHFLDKRIVDKPLRRLINKWLKAGVLEEGVVTRSVEGTPQGGVISPLLSNIYLHEVMDTWFVEELQPRLRGKAHLIRFADDLVLVFSRKDDARQALTELPERFSQFGLTLHPTKTRLVKFKQPRRGDPHKADVTQGRSFDFLGLTHLWRRNVKGRWIVAQTTATDRMTRSLTGLNAWSKKNRHTPIPEQHRTLCSKLRGHYNYYGITGNNAALNQLRSEAQKIWHKWLNRRSQRKKLNWAKFNGLVQRHPLPIGETKNLPRGCPKRNLTARSRMR